MKQTIYVDILIFVNLLINYFLLLTVRSFLHISVGRIRVFLGALCGAIGSLVIFLPQSGFISALFFRLAISVAMIAVCFCPVSLRLFIKLTGLLYLSSFGFAGFMIAASAIGSSSSFDMGNGAFYIPVSPMLLLILAVAAYAVIRILNRITGPAEQKEQFCEVAVYENGIKVILTAKIDTGSTLTEPFSHKPVIVAEKSAVENIIPLCLLNGCGVENWSQGIRMIPYHAVSGYGYLAGFIPQKMEVILKNEKITLEKCWLAVCDEKLGNGQFKALVPTIIFD